MTKQNTDVFHFINRCFTVSGRVLLIVEYVSLCIDCCFALHEMFK